MKQDREANRIQGVIRGREESVLSSDSQGVPQDDVQKKTRLGTTQ
jgi:hypothetical protein